MASFTAIVLVCLLPVAPDGCDEGSAVDVMSTNVASELGCTSGWQEIIARGSLREGLGGKLYLKTLCRRNGKNSTSPTPR